MATADRPGWRTSSFSGNGESCVEVASGTRTVRVRDTKDQGAGTVLTLGPTAWAAFRAAAVDGEPRTGPLAVTLGLRTTTHAGTVRDTTWHVAHDGQELHFTDAERLAFARGIEAGEFGFVAA